MAENQTEDSEKTEEPTFKRLEDARNKGDVPKSQEVSGAVLLCGGLAVIMFAAPDLSRALTSGLSPFFEKAHQFEVSAASISRVAVQTGSMIGLAMLASMAILIVAAIAGHLFQTGWIVSAEKIKPKLSKIDPISGAKRLFGKEALANFLKGLGKIAAVALAITVAIWPRRHEFAGSIYLQPTELLALARKDVIALLIAALVVYSVIAIIDFITTRMSWTQRQRMSLKEVKDEAKQAEGDPHIKAKLRAIRQEKARQRMMTAVPTATVVITNPTHYAVALKYEEGSTAAPICVAKGVEDVALRIRKIATDNGVTIVEDPPLARALYATIDIDEMVPEEHFRAVAKVIGYVLGLSRKKRP
jgi:flagellar biosynthesis protein FlhB